MQNKSLEEIADLIGRQDDFLLLTHRRPDGDTIGSAAAMCRALGHIGKRAWLAPNCDLTPKYQAYVEGLVAPADFMPSCVIALDMADEQALMPQNLLPYQGKVDIALDHHPSNKYFAAHTHMRANAAATGEIVYQLCRLLGVEPDIPLWEALYLAVSTDTGCFRFSNTTALAHLISAEAITAGINFYKINNEFFGKKSKQRMEIERSVLDHLIFSTDGRIGGSYLSRAEIDRIGAMEDDLDNLSSLIISIEGLACAVLVTQGREEGSAHKASVRTHKPLDASKICGRFDGGGHARAAGCTIGGELEEALERLMDVAAEEDARICGHV